MRDDTALHHPSRPPYALSPLLPPSLVVILIISTHNPVCVCVWPDMRDLYEFHRSMRAEIGKQARIVKPRMRWLVGGRPAIGFVTAYHGMGKTLVHSLPFSFPCPFSLARARACVFCVMLSYGVVCARRCPRT
jgi:hypothetical protein